MTPHEHACAVMRGDITTAAITGAIEAQTQELRGEVDKLRAELAESRQREERLRRVPTAYKVAEEIQRLIEECASNNIRIHATDIWQVMKIADEEFAQAAPEKTESAAIDKEAR